MIFVHLINLTMVNLMAIKIFDFDSTLCFNKTICLILHIMKFTPHQWNRQFSLVC